MKRILLSILAVVITTTTFAQDRAECERIAGIVFEAIGRQDMDQIKPHLSEVFEVSFSKCWWATWVVSKVLR